MNITLEDDITTLLSQALIKNSLVESYVIEELIQNRDIAVDLAKKKIQGICYMIDYYEKKLKIFDTYTKEVIKSISLPGKTNDFNPIDFDNWGTDSIILNTEEIQREGEIPYDKKDNYGIVLKNGKSYLYNPNINNQILLGLTSQYISGSIPKQSKSSLPFDMYFSSDYSLLCLTNRDEGKVYLFDVESASFKYEINVRNQGMNKTINLAISMVQKKIYITDNLSPFLIIYDLVNKRMDKKNLSIGILGNLCLSPDEQSIYMVITKPEQNLKNINIHDFSEIKSFSPKGELFSRGDAPCDLISLSPDKKHIFFMTFINDPNPFTPVISVINTEKNKPVKRFSIKDELKPINLCFEEINPVGSANKSLEEMLIEKKIFSINKLRYLKNAILNGEEISLENEQSSEGFVEIEGEDLEFEIRSDINITPSHHSSIIPKKTNHVLMPKKANKHIKECLVNSFWMKHEIDLKEIPEIQDNLDTIVERVRVKLEDYDLEIVEVKAFYDKKQALEAIILREFILEMLDEENSEDRREIKTAPTKCPNCNSPLLGSWDCTTCGFGIEKPEDAIRRKIASMDPLSNLTKGNILLPDPLNGELFEVDSFKVPVWKISKHQLDLKSITSAIRLENMNTMILDGEAGEIVEITPKGKIVRRIKVSNEDFPLNNPSFFTIVNYDHLLIADTGNHRIMETDLDGTIIWEYGKYGISGIRPPFLNSPSYIQKTYEGTYLITDTGNNRVIELIRSIDIDTGYYVIKIDWEYGNEINVIREEYDYNSQLNNPTMALKEISGNMVILDEGNKRLIEVNTEKSINWEYNTETKDEATNISNPERFIRLKNKDVLLIGDGKYIQFMPLGGNRIIWSSNRKDLSVKISVNAGILQENFIKIKVKHGVTPKFKLRVPKYEIRKPEELEKELEEIIAKKMLEATIAPPLWVDSKKPLSFFTPNKKVLPMPVLLIDKVNNKIMMADREANVFWSYGDNKVEKLVRVKTAEITPEKTVLIINAKGLIEVNHEKLRDYYSNVENELKITKEGVLISDITERIWKYQCNAESAVRLQNGNTLISESKKLRIIELNKDENIVWEHQHITYALASYATRLENGNTLIAYSSAHIVVEVTSEHNIVWSFGENKIASDDDSHLSFPEYACRLENGNTLIADTKNSRIIEVNNAGKIVWSFRGTELIKLISPNYVKRLKNNNTYITHGGNREVIEVDIKGDVVWKLVLPLQK